MKGLSKISFLFKKEIIIEILVFVVVAVTIMAFIKPIKVSGHSMDNTLSDGDLIFVSRQAYSIFGEPENGDIVVFPYRNSFGERLFVKRIIALEGQRLQIKNNQVFVDGKLQSEEYIGDNKTDGNIDLIIPKGQAFVMGDNRQNSTDSRSFGTIDVEDIKGKVFFRLLPLNKFGGL